MGSTRWMMAVLGMFVVVAGGLAEGAPLGTAFAYQGQLKQGSVPKNGTVDFEFSLWDAPGSGDPPIGGNQLGSTQSVNNVNLTAGLFSAELNQSGQFGPSAFTGDARWLQIAVRSPAGVGNFSTLSPRQSLGAVPYALHALAAGGLRLPLSATTSGFGGGLSITNTGALGSAGSFANTNGGNSSPALVAHTSGVSTFATAFSATASSGGTAVSANSSLGPAGNFTSGGGLPTLSATNNGAGPAFIATGSVGIGTTTPGHRLDVAGRARVRQNTPPTSGNTAGIWLYQETPAEDRAFVGMRNDDLVGLYGAQGAGWGMVMDVATGNVGIGTTTIPTGVKLAVDGKVLCEELEVQLSGDWPDYVFDDSYELMPLSELEQSIEQNGHLPGVPSAAQVAEKGLNVGQMQAKTLQKVEELTLYVLQLNAEMNALRQENRELQARISSMESVRRAD